MKKLIFFTSDWHLFHEKSIAFDDRPFRDLSHMHKVLINNYNAIVPKDGICYFLGDQGMYGHEKIKKIMAELNGTKILIIGNHDRGVNAMYNMGFDAVLHGAVLYIAQKRVTLSHCPLLGVYRENTAGMKGCSPGELWHGANRPKNQRLSFTNEDQFHLHGHVHSPNDGKSQKILDKQYDIGVVANKYRPVSISVIESWISKYGR